MKTAFGKWVAIAVLLGAATAHAVDPEHERLKLVAHFKHTFPDIPFEDYIQGALVFDPDARSQYDSIMAYPPFAAELAHGERLWHTPFANGKTYADCLPNAGRMIAGNHPYFDEARGRVVTFGPPSTPVGRTTGKCPIDMATGRPWAYSPPMCAPCPMA